MLPLSNDSFESALLRDAEDGSKFSCQLKNETKPLFVVVPNAPLPANLVLGSVIVAAFAGAIIVTVRKAVGISVFGDTSEKASFRHMLCMKWLTMDQDWLKSEYGSVGMEYLVFQRHVLLLLAIVCVAATGVILPVNYFMGQKYSTTIERITLGNLNADSPWMWLHIAVAVLIVPCAVLIMKRYLTVIAPSVYDLSANRVLIMEHLPEELRGNDLIRWIANKYPWCSVSRMYKTFPTRRLFALHNQVKVLKKILKQCEPESTLCCSRRNTPAGAFYQERLNQAEEDLRHERIASQMQPLDITFVVMKTTKMAKEIFEFESNELIADERINVTMAPAVEGKSKFKVSQEVNSCSFYCIDIEWRNMDYRKQKHLKRWIFYFFVLLFVVFCTTPEYLVFQVDRLMKSNSAGNQSGLIRYTQVLLLFGLSKLFPFVMVASINHLGYYRQSSINRKILLQTGSYLVLAIVVGPFFAHLSIFGYLQLAIDTSIDAFQNRTLSYWEW
jgi:hypothetical protein